MGSLLRPAIVLFLIMTALTGIAYPLAITGIAQVLFHEQASGSVLVKDGKPIGSRLIGQSFIDPKNFWSRPSATRTIASHCPAMVYPNPRGTSIAILDPG